VRKFIVLLAIMAGALIAIGGAGATTASASSCSVYHGPIFYDGNLDFNAHINNCSGVDQVQWAFSVGTAHTGIADCGLGASCGSNQTLHYAWGVRGTYPTQNIGNGSSDVYVTFVTATWGCAPQVTHYVYTGFEYRIHASGGAWGPWHGTTSGLYGIWC
jgi:hypothetical protein